MKDQPPRTKEKNSKIMSIIYIMYQDVAWIPVYVLYFYPT